MRVGRHEVPFSNPDKPYFPQVGLTKGGLVEYYLDVADCALPHLRRRPFHMVRYPHGVEGDFFHQKRVPAHPTMWASSSCSFRAATRPSSR
jgi:bifunctional non-homologous end joining protein LigD